MTIWCFSTKYSTFRRLSRILVELPGVKDPERVRKLLQGTAQLEFWETYENAEILGAIDQVNTC